MPGTSQQFPAQTGFTDSGQVAADTEAFRFVKSTTDAMSNYKYGAAAAADNAKVCGISMNKAVVTSGLGEPIGICFGGIGLITVNAASTNIIAGDPIACGAAAGIGTKATTGVYHVQALEPANTDGAIIRCRICIGSVIYVAP
jgi:hypothetical protein